jgi:hypothetical protein
MWQWQTEYWIALLAVLYLVTALSRSNLFRRRRERQYLEIWKEFADRNNLQFSPGSFSPNSMIKPQINGTYRKRQVSIFPETQGKWRLSTSVLKITVSIENPPTDEMPRGAFFVIGDPRKQTLWTRLFKSIGAQQEEDLDVRDFPMKCVPPNLGNHLLSLKSMRRLMLLPQINDLLVAEELLHYRQVGLGEQANAMQQILDDLCELAGNFERFVRNWVK